MSTSTDFERTEAMVLDAGGVQTLAVGKAIGKVRAALSNKSHDFPDLYGILVYRKSDRKRPANHLGTWNAFLRAYWQSWRRLGSLTHTYLTHPDQDHLASFGKQDFGDICVFWGHGAQRDLEQSVKATLGVYLLPSHLDVKSLGLPPLPEPFREKFIVIQVKRSEQTSEEANGVNRWNPWETLARSVTDDEQLDPEFKEDTVEWRKRFVSEIESWTSAEVARESNSSATNQAAIASRWTAERRIFSISFGGKTLFPRFQFKDGKPIPAVSKVIKAFPDHASGWDLAYFFTSPNSYIGGRKPLELLREDPKRLESLARSFANSSDAF